MSKEIGMDCGCFNHFGMSLEDFVVKYDLAVVNC